MINYEGENGNAIREISRATDTDYSNLLQAAHDYISDS